MSKMEAENVSRKFLICLDRAVLLLTCSASRASAALLVHVDCSRESFEFEQLFSQKCKFSNYAACRYREAKRVLMLLLAA